MGIIISFGGVIRINCEKFQDERSVLLLLASYYSWKSSIQNELQNPTFVSRMLHILIEHDSES